MNETPALPDFSTTERSQQPLYLLCRKQQQIWLYNLHDNQLYAAFPVAAPPSPSNVRAPACGTWMQWPESLFSRDEQICLQLHSDRYGMCEYTVPLEALSEAPIGLFEPLTLQTTAQPTIAQAYLGGKYNMRHECEWQGFIRHREIVYARVREQYNAQDAALVLRLNDVFYDFDFIDAWLHVNTQGADEYLSYAEKLLPVIRQAEQTCPMTLLQHTLTPMVGDFLEQSRDSVANPEHFLRLPDDFVLNLYLAVVEYQRQIAMPNA